MYDDFLLPWNPISSQNQTQFNRDLCCRASLKSDTEDVHEEEMSPAGAVPHQQIVCKIENSEETPAMAMVMASGSPTHSPAEDIFSDTMELASYLHRRVQEIGKQFRHHPFRISTSDNLESLPGFLQGLSCASELSLGSAIAKPGELAILREGERAPPLPEEKPSSDSCFTNRDLSVCAEMEECTIVNLYDNGFDNFNTEMKGCTTNHLYNSRPNEGRACSTEEARVLSLTRRKDNLPFSSENACNSACHSQRKGETAHVLPSECREGKLPILSKNTCVSMCCKQRFNTQESVMWDMSLKHVSDMNLAGVKEGEDLNTSLDAASFPASLCAEGKNPRSQSSTSSHDSSEHLLCHAPSDTNITEHLSLDLKLPSLQDHAISDAEDAVVQKPERDCGHAEHSSLCVMGSHMLCHPGLKEIPVLDESVRNQGSVHTQIMHSQAVAKNSSSPHSNARRSMSSVDSSECDNCGTDADKGRAETDGVRSRNGNRADGNKSEEIDAMSEAMHLDTDGKKEDEDETIVALGGYTSGKAELKNDALDLLFDAIQVTSGEGLVAKEDSYTCGPSSSHTKKHAPQRNSDKSLEERKQFSLAKMFQTTKKVSNQACFPERVYGSMHTGSNSSHRIQDKMHQRSSPELVSDTLSLPVGSFPIVRKRSNRCPKPTVTKEPSRNSVSPVVRFKSLQAVSEINLPDSREGVKTLAASKQDGEKVERGQSCLNGKRERTWEKQQDTPGKEDHFSKQEKREKFTDGDDLPKDRGKGQLPAMPASEGDEEDQGMLSRRARLQILPTKFSDSVLQPWKKGNRRRS